MRKKEFSESKQLNLAFISALENEIQDLKRLCHEENKTFARVSSQDLQCQQQIIAILLQRLKSLTFKVKEAIAQVNKHEHE